MPELPEVETTRRGIAPHVVGQTVHRVLVRNRNLRWPVPAQLSRHLHHRRIETIERRAKYLLLNTTNGSVIVHLGMSGSLRVVPATTPHGPYDHVEIVFANQQSLRLRDPRRFGCVLWSKDPLRHRLLRGLGIEPLAAEFTGDYLHLKSRQRRTAVKNLLMNNRVVCGVGNIYASEALYLAGIHPLRAVNRISLARYRKLAQGIREILGLAIAAGGTSLRDFSRADGSPGYFRIQLAVYGRDGEPCIRCRRPVRRVMIGQRSSFYCAHCQR